MIESHFDEKMMVNTCQLVVHNGSFLNSLTLSFQEEDKDSHFQTNLYHYTKNDFIVWPVSSCAMFFSFFLSLTSS